ncbi:MAG TPA: DNA methyltransferase [Gemmataceae bacterium]|nr:DNA methyltransferase [Gemmataceae bacterium]
MPRDPELLAHQQWLGYLQPVGLVVSPPALLAAQALVDSNVAPQHARFLEHVHQPLVVGRTEPLVAIKDLRALLLDVFGWRPGDLIASDDPRLAALEVVLPEYHETLRPTYAVPEDDRADPLKWLMLIQQLPLGLSLDEAAEKDKRRWQAAPQARFERLLRETQVPIGLLTNGTDLRLVYAPRGESTGQVTFPVRHLTETAGRPIFAALLMLLREDRLFSLADKQRLPAILAESRKYQNTVSTELAKQVLAALYELLRGFQAADALSKGELLREVLARDPDGVYGGLLTVLLRLVFLLYAEDRGLMSDDETYVRHYSVTGLFERLRGDAGRYPDTMDQRYGAWAQLLALFRLVHDGGGHGAMRLPARHGYLFQPDRYPFLEGVGNRESGVGGDRPTPYSRLPIPLVSDGVVFRVLQNLMILDGERISYSTLDVEQIGSVYETIMGFRLEKAAGRSVAIKPTKPHGAPVTVNLEALLQVPAKDRAKWLKEQTDQGVTGAALNALKAADSPESLTAALDRKVARELTPNIVPAGAMVLQPSDERRRSGSHYTPRSLTEPIVRKALEPILVGQDSDPDTARQDRNPILRPDDILALKVCDPAMGSGAFLVEACRQLGDELVKAWRRHDCLPAIPPHEDEVLHARRLVAQRCLYGVDKNPMAADLAKLSLWLATLAKDHPFTFLDHALRCGDSLVGLTRQQIVRFHWKDGPQQQILGAERVIEALNVATRVRQEIIDAGDEGSFDQKQQKLASADGTLNLVRFAGNLAVAAFFAADKDKKRQERRDVLLGPLTEYLRTGDMKTRPTAAEKALRDGPKGITPFHWEIEFPEVFGEPRPSGSGFNCIVGNPPFAGKNTIIEGHADGYLDWLKAIHPESHGNADLVAHFYRRAFNLLRPGGTFGLIATNTIAQGDTRTTGLRWICTHGGTIYAARRRYKWPGQAAVVVSVVHVAVGWDSDPVRSADRIGIPSYELDGKPVPLITAYLFHAGGHENPATLKANANKSFIGSYVLGMGFTFDDTDKDGVANPIALMQELIAKDERNAERIFPYIGGEEVNNSPTHAHHRYVINFGDMTEAEARRWPDLIRIVESKVRGTRASHSTAPWWQLERLRGELYVTIKGLPHVVAVARVGQQGAFTFLPAGMVYSEQLVVFAFCGYAAFCILQSRIHEVWARFFASSMKDDLRYTPSDCFETFPFPVGWDSDPDTSTPDTPTRQDRNPNLQGVGQTYYEFRAALMVRNSEGLTKTYNRFHDPNERSADIAKLRELHAAMDWAVLDAYGWTDLRPTCEFLLDYEDDEDDEESGGRQRKKPWRYRWPDEFRDEVLARLLELNKQRAEAEALAGPAEKPKKGGKPGRARKGKSAEGPTMFG